jgi:hypothetical protein
MVNDQWGRVLREWILFGIGCAMICVLTGKWFLTGDAPDVTLGGIALILVGVGNEVLKRTG